MFRKFGILALLMGIAGVILSSCSGLNMNYSNNADRAIAAEGTIAELNLPSSFKPEFTVSANQYTLVAYKPNQANSHLYLLQSTNPEDMENLEDALAQIAPGAYDPKTRLEVIESHSIILRGKETTFVISDGLNGEGHAYRQAVVPFDGNGGPALLIYLAPLKNWDRQVVNDLISSIR